MAKESNISEASAMAKQEEIIALNEKVKEKIKDKKWQKYHGDVCVRLFREFILREIPSKYTLSSPNAYIEGYSTEFDLLVVDKKASPIRYTNAYFPAEVKIGFEIKARGTGYGKHETLEEDIKKSIKNNFDAIRKHHQNINFVYFTYEESAFPKRNTSIQYLAEVKRIMKPYEVFCLRDLRTGQVISGEWERLAYYLNHSLQSS